MRFGMIGMVVMLTAATAGMAHGERDGGKSENRGLLPIIPPQPDYILKACAETVSTGNTTSAWRSVDPAGMLATYLQNHANRTVTMEMLAAIKTTLLQGTTHGKIFAEVDNTGLTSYHYDPTPNYEGDDRAVFLAEFEGKVYKIVIDLHVFEFVVDESASSCPAPKLIKVKKPASGSTDSGLDGVTVSFSEIKINGDRPQFPA